MTNTIRCLRCGAVYPTTLTNGTTEACFKCKAKEEKAKERLAPDKTPLPPCGWR